MQETDTKEERTENLPGEGDLNPGWHEVLLEQSFGSWMTTDISGKRFMTVQVSKTPLLHPQRKTPRRKRMIMPEIRRPGRGDDGPRHPPRPG